MELNETYLVCETELDMSHKTLLGFCLIIFGVLGSLLNIWLLVAFCLTSVLVTRTYLPFLSLCVVTICEELLAGYLFISASSFYGRWIFGLTACRLFALINGMLRIFEKLNIALIAFEEYLVTKQYNREKELPFIFYIISVTLSWLFSFAVSALPLIGYGEFQCDVTGVKCDLNWKTTNSKNIAYNIFVLITGDILPLIICYFCLKCSSLENEKSNRRRIRLERRDKRRTVVFLCILSFLFNVPDIILKSILLLSSMQVHAPVSLIIMALFTAEASKMFPVILYLMCETSIRIALINVLISCKITQNKKYEVSRVN